MTKLSTLLINLFVVVFLGLGSIVGFSLIFDFEAGAERSRLDNTPDDYEANNVYYLCNPTLTSTIHFLKGVPLISDGSNPNLNKFDLQNGQPAYFNWPGQGQRKAKLVYNQSFQGDPYLQLVVNSYERSNKVINVEVGIDTDNDNSFEIVCSFPPYHTTGDNLDGTMEEEVMEAYGTWQGGNPPAYIEGWMKMKVTMTSPNGNPCLLYCGFDNKLSWAGLPYMHTDLLPRAQINKTLQNQGFEELNKKTITVGEKVVFDGRDSYDPNDDLNGNKRIDDGYPGGEPNLGELDRLRYKWSFGDAKATNLDFANRNVSHVYTSDTIPKDQPFKIFVVNLTVMDLEGHTDWNRTYIKVYRGNNTPEILSLKINNVEQVVSPSNPFPKKPKSVLDQSIKVYFTAIAFDKDDDELTYYWDFNYDGEYEIFGDETIASNVYYTFSAPNYKPGRQMINLVVSDGTHVANGTQTGNITFVLNEKPIGIIQARKELDPKIYNDNITVRIKEKIIFDSSKSYDPDSLPGFDTNSDRSPDFQLKYKWNFNRYDSTATSGWITDKTYEYSYLSSGSEYYYIVTLDVDDGLHVNTSANFTVYINVRPSAKIFVEPQSYDQQGNFKVNRPVYFNGTGSGDPNKDPIINYTWDFGDGNKSYKAQPVHVFTTPSEYTVSLIVHDYQYASSPDQIKVDIPFPPKAPILRYLVYPFEVYTLENVNFDASMTSDPDSDMKDLKFKWHFGDNTTSTDYNTTHRFLKSGKYTITLDVTDETGTTSSESRVVVNVLNRKPIARLKQMKNVPADERVLVSGDQSRDDDGIIVSYLFNFGDGSETDWTNDSTVEHKWKYSGTYTITLTVQDDSGLSNETQMQIKVVGEESGGISTETMNTIIAGVIITVIIIVVVVIVIIMIKRSQEAI